MVTGKVFKYGDNVDTDVIIPARYLNSPDARELAKHCMEDIDASFASSVQPGDIVCFKTSGNEKGLLSYHFGIYMGKGYFIHASNTAKQVIVSKMKSYSGRFLGGMRLK